MIDNPIQVKLRAQINNLRDSERRILNQIEIIRFDFGVSNISKLTLDVRINHLEVALINQNKVIHFLEEFYKKSGGINYEFNEKATI